MVSPSIGIDGSYQHTLQNFANNNISNANNNDCANNVLQLLCQTVPNITDFLFCMHIAIFSKRRFGKQTLQLHNKIIGVTPVTSRSDFRTTKHLLPTVAGRKDFSVYVQKPTTVAQRSALILLIHGIIIIIIILFFHHGYVLRSIWKQI